jgi:hypothetical protein
MNTGVLRAVARRETRYIKTGETVMPDGLTANFHTQQLVDWIFCLSELGK